MKNTILFDTFSDVRESMSYQIRYLLENPTTKKGWWVGKRL